MKVKSFFNLVMWDFFAGCAYQAGMKLYVICSHVNKSFNINTQMNFWFCKFTFIHLADAVIQCYLQGIRAKHVVWGYWEFNPSQ